MSLLINFSEAPDRIKQHYVLSRFIIDQGVELKRKGKEWVGLCPFHAEKTPSFSVNDEKGLYLCRGCGETGDIISFVSARSGIKRGMAIRQLASEMGLKIEPSPSNSRTSTRQHQKITPEDRKVMTEVHDHTAQVAHRYLLSLLDQPDHPVTDYLLEQRGFSIQSIRQFGMGYLPSTHSLWEWVSQESSYNPSPTSLSISFWRVMAIEAGLLNDRFDKSMFQGRLLFPITNSEGRCVAFSGRVIPRLAEQAVMADRKYINSPATNIFDKSQCLFGLVPWHYVMQSKETAAAWRRVLSDENCVVVEGVTDVMRITQFGVRSAGAMGTAITKTHLSNLFSHSNSLWLITDADQAGNEATKKTLLLAIGHLKAGQRLFAIALPAGEDPDSYFGGLEECPDPIAHFWHLVNGFPRQTPEEIWFDYCIGKVGVPICLADQVRIERALAGTSSVAVTSDPMWRLALTRYVADRTGYYTRPLASIRSAYSTPNQQAIQVVDDVTRFWLYRIARAPEILVPMTRTCLRSWWVNDSVNGLLSDELECPPTLRIIFQAARAVVRSGQIDIHQWGDLVGALLKAQFPSVLLVTWAKVSADSDKSLSGIGYESEMLAPDLWIVEFQEWTRSVERQLNNQLNQALSFSDLPG